MLVVYKTALRSELFFSEKGKRLSVPLIIYCYLAPISVMGEAFTYENYFDPKLLQSTEGEWHPVCDKSVCELARLTGFSRVGIYDAFQWLDDVNLIHNGRIRIIEGLFSNPYIKLVDAPGLNAGDRIVYSYIVERTKMVESNIGQNLGSVIDTFEQRLAAELNMSVNTLAKHIAACKKKGYLERICNIDKSTGRKRWYLRICTPPINQ